MPSDIIMPQMGESITEGTITKWRVAVGDSVERDDPLFDIATDKVDTEVPAALTGRLVEILVPEGETVTVNTVVGRIAAEGEVWSPGEPPEPAGEPAPAGAPETDGGGGEAASEAPAPSLAGAGARAESVGRQPRSSPLVRRMAREHGVDLTSVPGTGEGGRVSKQDMLAFLEGRDAAKAETAAPAEPAVVKPLPAPAAPPMETRVETQRGRSDACRRSSRAASRGSGSLGKRPDRTALPHAAVHRRPHDPFPPDIGSRHHGVRGGRVAGGRRPGRERGGLRGARRRAAHPDAVLRPGDD